MMLRTNFAASLATRSRVTVLLSLFAALLGSADVRTSVAADVSGYQSKTRVAAPTRLDWVFALANQSLTEPPADWLKDYDSTAAEYELFVPPGTGKKPLPLVLFISPSAQPAGWGQWGGVCRKS